MFCLGVPVVNSVFFSRNDNFSKDDRNNAKGKWISNTMKMVFFYFMISSIT
jgi:hypothetical protein